MMNEEKVCANCNHYSKFPLCHEAREIPIKEYNPRTFTCGYWQEYNPADHRITRDTNPYGSADAINIGTTDYPCYVMGVRIPVCRW